MFLALGIQHAMFMRRFTLFVACPVYHNFRYYLMNGCFKETLTETKLYELVFPINISDIYLILRIAERDVFFYVQ